MSLTYFSELLPVLADRAKLSTISDLGFANVPLRRHLMKVFDRPFGEPGAYLADPTFEAVFGWRKSDVTMSDLAGSLLSKELVVAMDKPPKDLADDYRFARTQSPYTHQIEACNILRETTPQSLVVASGTGSGKTECFMVPILDKLIRERSVQQSKLIGVRALFLYPLNALINSQRERLKAWTQGFGSDIRFALYNGNTPERPDRAQIQNQNPSEVTDRKSLRSSPPPILVTNSTMLEYMLVRTADSPILAQSQGKLEWVVLDEAHTYIGSQAAEAALLIRRVLLAFGVTPDQVRFVATSATIGDPDGEAGQRLRQFLADVAGVGLDRVHLVTGDREVPSILPSVPISSSDLSELTAIHSDEEVSQERYDALVSNRTARAIRDLFVGAPNTPPVSRLSEICGTVFGPARSFTREQQREALEWLDLLSGTRNKNDKGKEGDSFLPVRGHLFHQTLSGLWACCDEACPIKVGSDLDGGSWPFGQVYLEPRRHCECGSPAYEVVACGDCGMVDLLGGVDDKGHLTHLQNLNVLDDFELDVEPGREADENEGEPDLEMPAGRQSKVLIVNRPFESVHATDIERLSRLVSDQSEATVRVYAHEESNGLVCPACGGRETPKSKLLRSSRIGAPFLLGGILPTLLEFAPDGEKPLDHIYRGRRLLSFNDSRQGTARMAARLQQDSERTRVRGLVYHLSLQAGTDQSKKTIDEIDQKISEIEQVLTPDLPVAARQVLEAQLSDLRTQRDNMSRPTPIGFDEMAARLSAQGRDFDNMLSNYRRNAPSTFGEANGPTELARMFLIREFGRRPRRQNNLESMGMVALHYPALQNIGLVPAEVSQAAGFDLDTWRDFLKICVDFFVRAGGSLNIPFATRNWLGLPFPQTVLVSQNEPEIRRGQRRWPQAKRGGLRSTLVRLLAKALKTDHTTPEGEDRIDVILQAAWNDLCSIGLLRLGDGGLILPFDKLAFAPMSHGWICPVTRRFLDVTLNGITPYLPETSTDETSVAQRVDIPLYDEPFGGITNELDRIQAGRVWISQQPEINELREQGLWSIFNDRTIELAPYFTTAEHSAQQDSQTLQRYEKQFKQGDLNLLSCSTTMEMGIDIGGISMVSMNNVPPNPANYLQRAGRAGRRHESRSLAMTLCKSNPHDQSVFGNSRWAFDSSLPAPQVALDSQIIVQRHLNSFLLSRFLGGALAGAGQEQTKLSCGVFFQGDEPLADRFSAWCLGFTPGGSDEIATGIRQIILNTICDGKSPNQITSDAAFMMDGISKRWRLEWEQLEAEEVEILQTADSSSPAFKAVTLHKRRLADEYLLRELASRGFLPVYGFPTHIASFDNLTVGHFLRDMRNSGSREDNRYRRRELASRDLTTALREYAPGSEVVIDGLVYRSAGVTLNWHVPADQFESREIQDIKFAWRCQYCGASGSSRGLEAARHCEYCGTGIESKHIREFLEPAGFAVDFYKDPGNDVNTQHYVPVEAPWINANGEWFPLLNPELGRFRTSTRGHLFHQSRGINGTGYALCLECGRSEPMDVDGTLPHVFTTPHRKLRRTKDDAGFCPGSSDSWKVKSRLTLGHEIRTDVVEIQLKTEAGIWLNKPNVAWTLAVAFRDALADLIGVQASELGCDVKPARPEEGVHCQSILIFDRHSAGYASSAERYLGDLFRNARNRLLCPANCDSACPHCVLDYDQRFAADRLDRIAALEVLTKTWIESFRLPDEFAFFGEASKLECRSLSEALWDAVRRQSVAGIRFHTGGVSESWDLAPSPLRELAYRLAGQTVDVVITVPTSNFNALTEADRYLLASMADHPHISVQTVPDAETVNGGWLLAETIGERSTHWAMGDDSATAFGPEWGATFAPLVRADGDARLQVAGDIRTAEMIRPVAANVGDLEIEIAHELDGELHGFGKRFWEYLGSNHSDVQTMLQGPADKITSIVYKDRYLYSPLSAALLVELVTGLKGATPSAVRSFDDIQIVTTNPRTKDGYWSGNKVWCNWPNGDTRNEVMKSTLQALGIRASIQIGDNSTTDHARILEIGISNGSTLSIRLDQGVGYWRGERAAGQHSDYFNPHIDDIQLQARNLANLKLQIVGSDRPTQIFIKMR